MKTEQTPTDRMQRIRSALRCSYDKVKKYREQRLLAISQYVGHRYSENGAPDKVPINMLYQAVAVHMRQMAARTPKAAVWTRYSQIKPDAANLELALDYLSNDIRLKQTGQRVVLNGLFGIMVVKIGLDISGETVIENAVRQVGQPYAQAIDIDDFVFDVNAKTFEECTFVGDRYELPLDFVLNSSLYNSNTKERLKPGGGGATAVDFGTEDKAAEVSTGRKNDEEKYEKTIPVWDVYFPRTKEMMTIVDGENDYEPLREWKWDGPKNGPYRMKGFGDVPNNILPLPPVAMWMDLHDLANRIFNKLGRQVERQKTITGVKKGAETDGKAVREANDGEITTLEDPDNVKEFKFGGAEATSIAFLLQVKDWFNSSANNVDALGGLGPQSGTLGQDELISQNASKTIAEMQDRVNDLFGEVMHDLAWYLWSDPLIRIPITKRVDGIEIPSEFNSENRTGEFLDYNVSIVPYSMQEQTPQIKLAAIYEVFDHFIAPFAQMLEAQGMGVDFEKLLRLIAKLKNVEEIMDVLTFMRPSMPAQGPVLPPVSGKPATTTRNYVRTSRPGATRSGKDAAMAQLLMGGKQQESEMAAAMRPVG